MSHISGDSIRKHKARKQRERERIMDVMDIHTFIYMAENK